MSAPGKKRRRLAFAERLQGARELRRGQVGDARSGPPVADHVHWPALAVGDALRQAVGQRILGAADADAGSRRVSEHDQPKPGSLGGSAGGCDHVIHVEARVQRQELHAAQPHELHGHDAGERADEGAEHASHPDEATIHAMKVANADG